LWLIKTGEWREGAFWLSGYNQSGQCDLRLTEAKKTTRWLYIGISLLAFSMLLSGFGAEFTSEYSTGLVKYLKEYSHYFLKFALLPWIIFTFCLSAIKKDYAITIPLKVLLVCLVANLVYAIAQKYTGIDWVHGFDAKLGSHRFAYGIYRVSGFMAHPLTYAYNFGLMALTYFMVSKGAFDRKIYLFLATVALVTVLISGSRFPVIGLIGILVLFEIKPILRHKAKVLPGLLALLGLLYFEGSFIKRFAEIFNNSAPIFERFPRLTFWHAHWEAWTDNILFGVGYSGGKEAMLTYYNVLGYHDKIYSAHNIFLQVLADSGVIGLMGLIGFLVCLYKAAREHLAQKRGCSLLVILVAAIVFSLIQNSLRDSEFIFCLWISIGVVLLTRRQQNN